MVSWIVLTVFQFVIFRIGWENKLRGFSMASTKREVMVTIRMERKWQRINNNKQYQQQIKRMDQHQQQTEYMEHQHQRGIRCWRSRTLLRSSLTRMGSSRRWRSSMTPCIIPTLSTGNHIMSKFNLLLVWFWINTCPQLLFYLWAPARAHLGAFKPGWGASCTFEEKPAGEVLPRFSKNRAGKFRKHQVIDQDLSEKDWNENSVPTWRDPQWRKYIFSCRGSTVQIRSVKELFGELDDGQLEDLVEVYKEDFGIHGYDPHIVLR